MKPECDKLPLVWGLLPTFATLTGLVWLDEALIAVLLYHAGIAGCMVWKRFPLSELKKGFSISLLLLLGGLCMLTWPLISFLWPFMVLPEISLAEVLVKWRITGPAVWIFVIYSLTIHPVLEESFWRGLMPDTWKSDGLFAAFHLIVLYILVHAVWLPLAFVVLTIASTVWRKVAEKHQGLAIPVLTHAVADVGVILAVRGLLM